MGNSLYSISDEMKNILNSIDNLEEGQELDISTFESLQGDFNGKIVNVIKYMRSLIYLSESAKEESKALAMLSQQYENKANRMESYIDLCLKKAGITELDTPIAKIKYAPSKSVVILDEDAIDEKYFVRSDPKKSLSKSLIGDDIKAGIEVKGAIIDPTPLIKITTPKGK